MQLQFKNKHIFFALESIWDQLDYKFKYHINELVSANSEDEFEQSVTIDSEVLLKIYEAVSSQPEGIAAVINAELVGILTPQIQSQSNLQEVMNGDNVEPNEAAKILIEISKIQSRNGVTLYNKILNGKTQILQ